MFLNIILVGLNFYQIDLKIVESNFNDVFKFFIQVGENPTISYILNQFVPCAESCFSNSAHRFSGTSHLSLVLHLLILMNQQSVKQKKVFSVSRWEGGN